MFSLPGKINHVNKAKLTIHLTTGHMLDFKEWVESSQECVVKITLNDVVLYHNTVDQPVQLEHEFLDQDPGSYKLKIEVEKIVDGFDVDGIWASPMLHITGTWIENLNLRLALEEYGRCHYPEHPDIVVPSEYMGSVGETSLEFTTPIYKWLMQCDQYEDTTYYSPMLLNTA